MRRLLLVFLGVLMAGSLFAQKDGEYLTIKHPLCNLWELDGDVEQLEGAMIAGSSQQFIFFIEGDSKESMMAPFEMEGMGFACPSYFTASCDKKYVYFQIHESCSLGLPDEEKYVKVRYEVSKDGKYLTLTIDGKVYKYKKWKS